MTKKEYTDYKRKYLKDFKIALRAFMNEFIDNDHNHSYDKKLNDTIMEFLNNDYRRLETLLYFPEYELPE